VSEARTDKENEKIHALFSVAKFVFVALLMELNNDYLCCGKEEQ
jgi:hypothetical protein